LDFPNIRLIRDKHTTLPDNEVICNTYNTKGTLPIFIITTIIITIDQI